VYEVCSYFVIFSIVQKITSVNEGRNPLRNRCYVSLRVFNFLRENRVVVANDPTRELLSFSAKCRTILKNLVDDVSGCDLGGRRGRLQQSPYHLYVVASNLQSSMTSTAKGAIAWIETCLIRPDVLSLGIQQVLQ
jgi:hypothetical protein